jgi:hypothetical protein
MKNRNYIKLIFSCEIRVVSRKMDFNQFLMLINMIIIGYGTYADWKRNSNSKSKYDVYSDRYWRDSYGDFDGQLFWSFMCREIDHVIRCQENFIKKRMDDDTFNSYKDNIEVSLGEKTEGELNWKRRFNRSVNKVRLNSDILRGMA